MMILNIKPSIGNKTADTLTIGDILCKKSDSFYYELLNITQNNMGENYYHFYGFVVKGIKNLKHHFISDQVLFPIFEK